MYINEPFPNTLDGCIILCKKKIEAGIDVRAHRQYLDALSVQQDELVRLRLAERVGEPEGLDDLVYRRISTLKNILQTLPELASPGYPLEIDRENIEAVLATYRAGKIGVEPGKCTCWSGGKMFAPLKERTAGEIRTCAQSAPTPGNFWLEDAEEESCFRLL